MRKGQQEEREDGAWTGSAGPWRTRRGGRRGGSTGPGCSGRWKTSRHRGLVSSSGHDAMPRLGGSTNRDLLLRVWRPEAMVRCQQGEGLPRALCPVCQRLPSRWAVSPSALLSREGRGPHAGEDDPGPQGTVDIDGCSRGRVPRLLWTQVLARKAFHLVTHHHTPTHIRTHSPGAAVFLGNGVFCPAEAAQADPQSERLSVNEAPGSLSRTQAVGRAEPEATHSRSRPMFTATQAAHRLLVTRWRVPQPHVRAGAAWAALCLQHLPQNELLIGLWSTGRRV